MVIMGAKRTETITRVTAVVARSRGSNVSTEHLQAAFGDDVIIIDTDAEVRNGFEYIGKFSGGEKLED